MDEGQNSIGQGTDWSALLDQLGISGHAERNGLDYDLGRIADRYQRWSEYEADGPSRAIRNSELKKLQKESRKLSSSIDSISMSVKDDIELMLHATSNKGTIEPIVSSSPWIDSLSTLLHRFEQVSHSLLTIGQAQKGPKVRLTLAITISQLCDAYVCWTGKAATHTPYKKTVYTGRPHSEVGQFVVAFFNVIDPSVTDTQISNLLRKVIDDRRKLEISLK